MHHCVQRNGPSANLLYGQVKWFNPELCYGFIVPQQGPEHFVHARNILDPHPLEQGDFVVFHSVKTPKGARAINVRRVSTLPFPETVGASNPPLWKRLFARLRIRSSGK